MLIDIFAVLLLSITVLGTQDPTRLNPRDLDLGEHQRNVPSSGGIAARTITNARRLKADSSLGASKRRGDSAASTWCQGHLKLAMGDDENYGFVGKESNAFGEFTLATHEDDRLLVRLDMSTAMWRPIGIDLVDGPEPSLPFMAGIVGFSSTSQDLTLDSSNYIYLGASGAPTALSNSAQAGITSFSEATGISESFETVIFSYDHDGCFDILWVNDDSSEIKAFLGVVDQDGSTMIATGNKEMFEHEFGPTSWVNLSFVSKP
ncbi:hypothetical protein CPB85DRAFT_1444819 [Mucidula mucida]|nr:hypothetical protein CPB85DRAFT_1444819 [Mucidula mucida]